MLNREDVEKLLMTVRRQRDEAEASASGAADRLVRMASGLTRLDELDPNEIRAAADTYAGAVERLKILTDQAAAIRNLLA